MFIVQKGEKMGVGLGQNNSRRLKKEGAVLTVCTGPFGKVMVEKEVLK